jgi:hypothetical protein
MGGQQCVKGESVQREHQLQQMVVRLAAVGQQLQQREGERESSASS